MNFKMDKFNLVELFNSFHLEGKITEQHAEEIKGLILQYQPDNVCEQTEWRTCGDCILSTDNLIKVLDEVKREVEKHYEYDTSIYDGAPFRVENETTRVLDDISKIINQLKLK